MSLPDLNINSKISLLLGNITKIHCDAIVNAANNHLIPGGGVCGAIHSASGNNLAKECQKIGYCDTGSAVLTNGWLLPAKHVIHTVGPMISNHIPSNLQSEQLANCYRNCLDLLVKNGLESIAFCCISTGIYGYPIRDATIIALTEVKKWLENSNYAKKVKRIIFCCFTKEDNDIYRELLPVYFPV